MTFALDKTWAQATKQLAGLKAITARYSTTVNDPNIDVVSLAILAGDQQAIFAQPTMFSQALVVVAVGATGPIEGASIHFTIQAPSDACILGGTTITTGKNGTAQAIIRPGNRTGRLTVTATCNGHAVAFNLVVTPPADLLEIVPLDNAAPNRLQSYPYNRHVIVVRKRSTGETWPYIPITASISGSGRYFYDANDRINPLQTDSMGQIELKIAATETASSSNATLIVQIGNQLSYVTPC